MELILRAYQKGYPLLFVPEARVVHDPDFKGIREVFLHASVHAAKTVLLRNHYGELLKTPAFFRFPGLLLLLAPLIALKATLDIYRLNRDLMKWPRTVPLVYALKLAWCWGASRGLKTRQGETTRLTLGKGNKSCKKENGDGLAKTHF
jgi:hypothetical protein